jgi:VanZ family protein
MMNQSAGDELIGRGIAAPRTHASRLSRYLPLVIWIGVIFLASSNQMSAAKTSRLIGFLHWLFPAISDETLRLIHFAVRKTAHFVEYATLALIAARAFTTSSRNSLRNRWFLISFAVVVIIALLDEYNQSFIASRTGTIYDSLLDMTGGLTALVIFTLWRIMRSEQRSAA